MTNESAVQAGSQTASPSPDPQAITARRLRVIANPVSGTNREGVDQIKAALESHDGLEWEVCLTEKAGDARRFAQEAAQQGVDVVVAWGGDGTVMEIADGLRGSDVPMLVLPGGTANVMSLELGMPRSIEDGLALLWSGAAMRRAVDMGSLDSQSFLLRVGVGLEAAATAWTARSEKQRWGRMAYIVRGLRLLRGLQTVRYRITLDDKTTVVARGITCLICNSSNVGMASFNLAGKTDISDGLLDVIVIRDLTLVSWSRILVSIFRSVLPRVKESPPLLDYWQAQKITVVMNRRQAVARDGERLKRAKQVTASVIPHAVQMIVPAG